MTIQQELELIENIVKSSNSPLSRSDIYSQLPIKITEKTLQRRLKKLVDELRISTSGQRSGLRYLSLNPHSQIKDTLNSTLDPSIRETLEKKSPYNNTIVFSDESLEKLKYLEMPSYARAKASYNMSLIDNYVPNTTRYVTKDISLKLNKLGKRFNKNLAAGTYAKDIAQRLLIDLSFHSSRLEGNTYSILDTEKLLHVGITANGEYDEETIMILNHKEAILFLIENAEELNITPFVIRNLHQILAQDLIANDLACGQIRQIEVNITKTSYMPLNTPQRLEELFAQLLLKAERIEDPFEQSFFLLIHLSYLQAFEDVNKRTARLSCNIPFIQENLCPLSFIDVPKDDYIKSLIYFYETGDYIPALEVFIWAYERSSYQYKIVEKSIGSVDSYRIKYRKERKLAIGQIVRDVIINEHEIHTFLDTFCNTHNIDNADKFIAIAKTELEKLHSGAVISIGVTEEMFILWKKAFTQNGLQDRV